MSKRAACFVRVCMNPLFFSFPTSSSLLLVRSFARSLSPFFLTAELDAAWHEYTHYYMHGIELAFTLKKELEL